MGVLSEFAKTMQWRTRLAAPALAVGLCCGPVCTIYTLVMEFLIDKVWKEIPEMLFEEGVFRKFPNWAYIIFVCTFLGALSGLAIRQFGPPLLNLQAPSRRSTRLVARPRGCTAHVRYIARQHPRRG